MVEVKKESKCQICDSYNMKGMWQCECGVMNVSKNVKCWKCGLPRDDADPPEHRLTVQSASCFLSSAMSMFS